MSPFSQYKFDELLPPYLTSPEKQRITVGLQQFLDTTSNPKVIDYSGFFLSNTPQHLMQSDVLHSVKVVDWDEESFDPIVGYTHAIFISNTCDVNQENTRSINKKEALIAPIIDLEEYLKDLRNEGFTEAQVASFYNALKRQEFSNLFFIPKNDKNNKEFIVFFDKISWLPTKLLFEEEKIIDKVRFISFSNFGFYLFILKLSYHFCRVPEEVERKEE